MKTIEASGNTFIQPFPDTTGEWYYGIEVWKGNLYEADLAFGKGCRLRDGNSVLYTTWRERSFSLCRKRMG